MREIVALRNYRDMLRFALDRRKRSGLESTVSNLAAATGIHRPYLSKVLGGHADLNADQAYAACEFLGMSEQETEFTLVHLEFERTTNLKRKAKLKAKIRAVRNEWLEIRENITATKAATPLFTGIHRYYMNPFYQVVHIFLTIPRFQANTAVLVDELGISMSQLNAALEILVEEGLISRDKNGSISEVKDHVHLPSDSPLCIIHQMQHRMHSITRQLSLAPERSTRFSATISANPEAYDLIRERFNGFLKDIEPIVRAAPSEAVYQINFDLFPWGRSEQ